MSRVEDALKKIRESQPGKGVSSGSGAADRGAASRKVSDPSSAPVVPDAPIIKHAVAQVDLVKGGLLAPVDQAASVAEQFRRIKRPLLANAFGSKAETPAHALPNVIMIASALAGAGKTFCSVNLALSIALERELKVVLVDADVAKPHISREMGLSDSVGLIDVLLSDESEISAALVHTDLNEIQVLPAGCRHPQATELLASERMSVVVNELAKPHSNRIVIVDSPPLLMTTEAQALAEKVGQIVLVVEAGATSQQMLRQALGILDPSIPTNLVLNKTNHFGPQSYRDGGYGYYGYDQA